MGNGRPGWGQLHGATRVQILTYAGRWHQPFKDSSLAAQPAFVASGWCDANAAEENFLLRKARGRIVAFAQRDGRVMVMTVARAVASNLAALAGRFLPKRTDKSDRMSPNSRQSFVQLRHPLLF